MLPYICCTLSCYNPYSYLFYVGSSSKILGGGTIRRVEKTVLELAGELLFFLRQRVYRIPAVFQHVA